MPSFSIQLAAPGHVCPKCPNCGKNMWLTMTEEFGPGHESRTLRFPSCKTKRELSAGRAKSDWRDETEGQENQAADAHVER